MTLDASRSPGDFPRTYQVVVSNDGKAWSGPIAAGYGSPTQTNITFAPQNARFARIVDTGTSTTWWSIHELNVYGLAPAVLPRNGWSASASLSSSTAGAGIDANLSTRWTTGAPQANGQWYQLDLGSARTFNQIRLDSDGASSDYPRGYQVFVSNNPASFGAPVATGVGSASLVSIAFPLQNARYIRVVQTGSASSWWSIAEANVWGPAQ